jgi:hypothetical protein
MHAFEQSRLLCKMLQLNFNHQNLGSHDSTALSPPLVHSCRYEQFRSLSPSLQLKRHKGHAPNQLCRICTSQSVAIWPRFGVSFGTLISATP